MSETKRRISGNKGFVGLPLEDHDDDDDEDSNGMNSSVHSGISRRRSLGGRRRSSFGSHNSKSPGSSAEQSRIAEMYKNVIKMSSENKINDKNSWNLDLIDHMGNLIKGDATGSRGVNFQKASCTLDASVKIYSHRVDDTHSSSQAMVESLNRTLGGDDSQARGAAKVGSKTASNKLNIANTIATNVDTINSAKVERVQATDPMFHKLSKAFDDGGAKGMLMANLRVSSTECSLSFSSGPELATNSSLPQELVVSPALSPFDRVDISDLISRCGFDAASLMSMSICPALSVYRETIGVSESLCGAYDPIDFVSHFPDSKGLDSSSTAARSPEQRFTPLSEPHISTSDFDYGDDDDNDGGDNDGGDFGSDSFGDFSSSQPPPSARKSMGIALNRRSSTDGHIHKIQWDSESDRQSVVTGVSTTPQSKGTGDSLSVSSVPDSVVWDASGISCTNDYSFFDIDMVNKSNNWAGARHWKYATRRQAAIAQADTADDVENAADVEAAEVYVGKTASRSKAAKDVTEKFCLPPMSEIPSEDLFAIPKSKTRGNDVTCLTAAALDREAAIEQEGGLFLPPDAKLQSSDLCRLMLCHSIIVPPPMLAHVFMKQAASSSSRAKGKSLDVIWGQVRKAPVAATSSGFNPMTTFEDDDDDDDNSGGGYGEDFCDPDGDDDEAEEVADTLAAHMEKGLHISSAGLLRAGRTVEKIDIGFATVAKKVNVKRLKFDIWSHLDELETRSSLGSDGKGKDASSAEDGGGDIRRKRDRQSLCSEEISFQDLVCDITNGQKQKDVTLPFYFICLLHLANEKTLRIDGSPEMNDLFISKDT